MKTQAPFTEEQLNNINAWQDSGFVHPLACPDNCDEFGERMFAIEVGMFCPQCDGLKQEWVPDGIANGEMLKSCNDTLNMLNLIRNK